MSSVHQATIRIKRLSNGSGSLAKPISISRAVWIAKKWCIGINKARWSWWERLCIIGRLQCRQRWTTRAQSGLFSWWTWKFCHGRLWLIPRYRIRVWEKSGTIYWGCRETWPHFQFSAKWGCTSCHQSCYAMGQANILGNSKASRVTDQEWASNSPDLRLLRTLDFHLQGIRHVGYLKNIVWKTLIVSIVGSDL